MAGAALCEKWRGYTERSEAWWVRHFLNLLYGGGIQFRRPYHNTLCKPKLGGLGGGPYNAYSPGIITILFVYYSYSPTVEGIN